VSSVDRIALYKRLLLRWTETVNLVGPEARRNIDEHIEEALAAARILKPRGDVLDVGSGGGLPAIPMAIVTPEARFHLVEADQKKWAFLKHVVRECALNSEILGDRLEHIAPRLDAGLQFSLVTSRAVGHTEEWIPVIAPRIALGGIVALFEGEIDPPAIDGFRKIGKHKLPRGDANFLLILEKFHVKQHG